jgi:uncharacterized membrane protein
MTVSQAKTHRVFGMRKLAAPTRGDALRRMEALAKLLDAAFVLPGTQRKIGIDAIIGLVPGIGDVVTTVLSAYIIWEARNLGVPRWIIGRMLANLALHASIGAIPVAGDAFDAVFQVNLRNMRLVRKHLDRIAR